MSKIESGQVVMNDVELAAANRLKDVVIHYINLAGGKIGEIVSQVLLNDEGLVVSGNFYISDYDDQAMRAAHAGVEKFAEERGCPHTLINIQGV